MHCLYVIWERKFKRRAHVKVTRHWKSTPIYPVNLYLTLVTLVSFRLFFYTIEPGYYADAKRTCHLYRPYYSGVRFEADSRKKESQAHLY